MPAPYINVLDPEFYVDPWDAYRWLREEAPVFWDPTQKLWAISRHEDVIAVERDGQLYSSLDGSRPHVDQRDDESMINMDDPEHQAQRNVVARRFTPNNIRRHEERVRQIATSILDDVLPRGGCEAVEAIASRLPAMMIADLLGYGAEDWERVRHWSEQTMYLAGQTAPEGPPHVPHPDLATVFMDWVEATLQVVEERQRDPRNDLISLWVHTPGWTTKRVMDEIILLLDGGAETTRSVIGTIIRELALQPEQRRRLAGKPGLIGRTGVEEFIRWATPISNMRRTVTADHDLHGVRLHQGDQVVLLYGAANRDPQVFDDPDRFDVTRQHNRHVAFGFGTHFCLGAHLARLEIKVLFEELLTRAANWRLVDPDEPRVVPSTFTRAYDRVRIAFEP